MGHKCYICFKTEDEDYKKHIQEKLDVDMIDKSLNEPIDSDNEDYILSKIRSDYLSDSTITIHLIGLYGAENRGWEEQKFIKRELQASLYNRENNTRSGILGIVLPDMYNYIYKGTNTCWSCGKSINILVVDDSTVIKEFSYNYFIPNNNCHWAKGDRYCVLVKWADFCDEPNKYIEMAFEKREAPIAKKVKVFPK